MKSAKIPNILLDGPRPKTLTAAASSVAESGPISPYSGTPMIYAKCRETPVFIDQSKRVVLPVLKQNQ